MDKVALLERKLQRECAARKEAERLLEEKSLQLYHANLQLKQQYELLEGKAGTTEQALQETQGRYELLVEQVHDFVFKTDAHGVFSYVNSACTRILGYNDQELLGHPYTKIIIGADKERVENFYRDLDSLPADNYLEFRVYAKDGTRRWVGQKVQPVNKEGELFEIIGVA
ncbi:MAG: PAS domain S-box protein, partial [Bacteroidota bacterium]